MQTLSHAKMYWTISMIAAIVGAIVFLIVALWPDTATAISSQQDDVTANRQSSNLSDREITEAIEKKITFDGIEVKGLKIYAIDGILTIDGTVESLGVKNHIDRLASEIRNVRGIVNQMKVTSSRLTDEKLEKIVERRLKRSAATDSFQIKVVADNGKITMSGIVDSLAEKILASRIAAEVRGVKSLESKIEVRYRQKRNDKDIQDELVARMKNHVWIDEQRLTVAVNNGAVTFDGDVATERRKSQLALLGLASGVKSINVDNVSIDPEMALVPKKNTSLRNDLTIGNALIDSINFDPRINAKQIDVKINQGIVILRGTVRSVQAKRAAVDTAHNVTGVSKVIDEINVETSEPLDDSTLTQKLKEEISATATLKYDGIGVSVESGVVTLTGTVPSYYQSRRAESVANSLRGVLEVNNQIEIDHPRESRSDFEIGLDIERAMRWSPLMDITKLKYEVADGIVKFTGSVADGRSLDDARKIAIDAGARDIDASRVVIQ